MNHTPECQDALRKIAAEIEADPYDPLLRFRMGMISEEAGDNESARDCYAEGIRLDPMYALGYTLLGWALAKLKRYAEAKDALETGLSLKVKTTTYVYLGAIHECLRETAEAIKAYECAIEADPDFSEPYLLLARLVRENDEPKAAALLERAIHLDADYGEAYSELGAVCLGLGEYERAEQLLRRAVDLGAELLWSHLYLGNALWILEKLDEAEAEFKKAIPFDLSSFALSQLGKFYLAIGRHREAEQCLVESLETDPSNLSASEELEDAKRRIAEESEPD